MDLGGSTNHEGILHLAPGCILQKKTLFFPSQAIAETPTVADSQLSCAMRKLEVQEQSQGSTKLLTQRGLGFWWCLWLRELTGMNWPQRLGHFGSSGCRALTRVPVVQPFLPAKSLQHCQRLASHCIWYPQHCWEAAGKGHQVLLKISEI